MEEVKIYIVYTNEPNYCGIGAGGIQFAYGKAEVVEGWVLNWYRAKGYRVEAKEEEEKPKRTAKK